MRIANITTLLDTDDRGLVFSVREIDVLRRAGIIAYEARQMMKHACGADFEDTAADDTLEAVASGCYALMSGDTNLSVEQ